VAPEVIEVSGHTFASDIWYSVISFFCCTIIFISSQTGAWDV